MHMRAAWTLLIALLAPAASGCLGIDNMGDLKAAVGYAPAPLQVLEPVARARASATLASVLQPVAFSAQGTVDPQGMPLKHGWDFGDGQRAQGAEATHRYATQGIYTVTLTSTNAAGLAGRDTVQVTVVENRAPVVGFAVTRGDAPVERALAGEALAFAAEARDPEGQALALRWELGDGAAATGPRAEHAYARGGRFTVALTATDPGGLATTATRVLAVDEAFGGQGRVAALGPASVAHALQVAPGAERVRVALAFDAGLGAHGLAFALLDAAGKEQARAEARAAPGTLGPATHALEVPAAALAAAAPGAWSLVVQLGTGAQVDYAYRGEVRYQG